MLLLVIALRGDKYWSALDDLAPKLGLDLRLRFRNRCSIRLSYGTNKCLY
jgi:hypothetical protein